MDWFLAAVFIGLIVMMISSILSDPPQYEPMTYEEEMRWLMEDCGLTEEEAHEIANLPHWGPNKE